MLWRSVGPGWGLWLLYCGTCCGGLCGRVGVCGCCCTVTLAVEVCWAGLGSVAVVLWHLLWRSVWLCWGLWLLCCGTCCGGLLGRVGVCGCCCTVALAVEVCVAVLGSMAVVLWHLLWRFVGPGWGLWLLLYCGTCCGGLLGRVGVCGCCCTVARAWVRR